MSETQQACTIEHRPAQPVAVLNSTVSMATLSQVADELPGLIGWAAERGYDLAGPPFLRYVVIDAMGEGAGDTVMQAGVPVAGPVEPGDGVEADELPAGDYLTTAYVGPYDGLYGATVGLLTYAGTEGLTFDKHLSDRGEVWASRLEWYETNPAEESDPARWVTRLTFKLAD